MRTVFGLFETYDEADEAVRTLLENDFDFESLNAIVSEGTAKNNIDMNYERRSLAVSDEFDGQVGGLDRLVGGRQPVPVVEVGPVYAGGDGATLLTRSMADQSGDARGFAAVLAEVNVPEETASRYRTGIVDGGVLLWVRSSDERAAEAVNLMEKTNAKGIGHYGA